MNTSAASLRALSVALTLALAAPSGRAAAAPPPSSRAAVVPPPSGRSAAPPTSSSSSSAAAAACSRSASRSLSGAPYALAAAAGSPFALCPVHDPAVAREGSGALYVLGTDAGGLPQPPLLRLRASQDGGATWAELGSVFEDGLPAWARAAVPLATTVWAPDVSLSDDGSEWRVYYAVSSFGSQTSAIGLVATPSLAQPVWVDRGLVFASGAGDPFNAIDPNLFSGTNAATGEREALLVFGSFWKGIFMLPVNASTGLLAAGAAKADAVHLAQRPDAPDALEGAFLVQRGAFHYLFASFDFCCRGSASTYNVRYGRSADGARGPFVDRAGVPMLEGGGTLLVAGGFGWAAGGGQSLLRESVVAGEPTSLMVLHGYDGESGEPFLNLVNVSWTSDGWPSL